MEFAHLGVRGEEAEGSATGDFKHAADFFGGLREEVRMTRHGHGGGQIEERLLRVIEVRGDDKFFGEWNAEAFYEVLEAGVCRRRRLR